MAQQIIDLTQLNEIPADGDLFLLRDVSDTADSTGGTDKFLNFATLKDAFPVLNNEGKIPSSYIPPIALSEIFVVQDIAERDALDVQEGDSAKVESEDQWYIYDGTTWLEMSSQAPVDSVNGQTGTVNLTYTDVDAASASDFNAHTGDSTIHFTQSQISITESQISDLGDYAVVGHSHTLSDITDSGTAAYEDITSGQQDTTTGLILQVGDHGIGLQRLSDSGSTGNRWTDFDDPAAPTGFYGYSGPDGASIPSSFGTLIAFPYRQTGTGNQISTYIAAPTSGELLRVRRYNNGWEGGWETIATEEWVNSQDYLVEADLGSAAYLNEIDVVYGENGGASTDLSDADAVRKSGFYRDNGSDWKMFIHTAHAASSSSYGFQFGVSGYNHGATPILRILNSGVWGANRNIATEEWVNNQNFATGDNFNSSGTYSGLRAQSTTKGDVGLGNVPNVDATNANNISSGTLAYAQLPFSSGQTSNWDTAYDRSPTGLSLSGNTLTLTRQGVSNLTADLSSLGGSVDESADYNWTGEHIFNQNTDFIGSNGNRIEITPVGWRSSSRAAIRLWSDGDNPAEIDLRHNFDSNNENVGWHISARDGNPGNLQFYTWDTTEGFNQRIRFSDNGDLSVLGGAIYEDGNRVATRTWAQNNITANVDESADYDWTGEHTFNNPTTLNTPGSGFAAYLSRAGTRRAGFYLTTASTEFNALNGNNMRFMTDSGEGRGTLRMRIDNSSGLVNIYGDLEVDGRQTISGGFQEHLYFTRSGGTDFNITRINSNKGGCSIKLHDMPSPMVSAGQADELNFLVEETGSGNHRGHLIVGGRSFMSTAGGWVTCAAVSETSSKAHKSNEAEPSLQKAYSLFHRCKGYEYDMADGDRHCGLFAEDLAIEAPEVVGFDSETGKPGSIRYSGLWAYAFPVICDMAKRIEELEQALAAK